MGFDPYPIISAQLLLDQVSEIWITEDSWAEYQKMLQQGKSQEALALTASLPAAELRKPRIALYHGIFLTLEGDAAAAAGFIALAQSGKIFPEEKAMLERTKVAVVNAAEEAEIAEAAKKAREAKAAMDLEKEKAVETARAARAAQAAKEARDAEAGKTPKTPK